MYKCLINKYDDNDNPSTVLKISIAHVNIFLKLT